MGEMNNFSCLQLDLWMKCIEELSGLTVSAVKGNLPQSDHFVPVKLKKSFTFVPYLRKVHGILHVLFFF